MSGKRATILLGESQIMVAEGLSRLLEADFDVVGHVRDGESLVREALNRETPHRTPDLVLTDLALDGTGGLEAARRILGQAPAVKILVLTAEKDPETVRAVFNAGITGYVLKSAGSAELLAAVREVLKGEAYVAPEVVTALLPGAEKPKIRVLVVDDHPVVRQGTILLLRKVADVEVVGEAENGREGVEKAAELQPDVVLMDLMMPEMNGIEATAGVRERSPLSKVLIMTASTIDERAVAAVRAGAVGYMSKSEDSIVDATRRVHRGESVLPKEVQRLLDEDTSVPELTNREREIAAWVARGLSNKEIAAKIHAAEATVRTHLRNVFEKMGLANRVELALYALRVGWIEID